MILGVGMIELCQRFPVFSQYGVPVGAFAILVTLSSLLAMHYQPFEVVVVDNAPSSDATRDAVLAAYADDARVRYVREPRPGLSCARQPISRSTFVASMAFPASAVFCSEIYLPLWPEILTGLVPENAKDASVPLTKMPTTPPVIDVPPATVAPTVSPCASK